MVLRARALGQFVHDHARLRVRGGLAEVDRLLRLHFRGGHPFDPFHGAVRMLRFRRDHPRVGPAGCAFLGDEVLHRRLRRLQRVRLIRPRRADRRSPALEEVDLVAGGRPVLLDEGVLLLQQVDGCLELGVRQLVRILDPEVRFRLGEVEGGVGDLDRIVRDRDLALVLGAVQHAPRIRGGLHLLRVVEERVRPPLQRDPVVHALDRVVGGRLQLRDEVLPVRDQLDVHGLDVLAVDQAQRGVARCGYAVVL